MDRRRALAPYPPAQREAGPPGLPARGGPAQVREALRRGRWDTAVRLVMGTGVTDVNQLTNSLFYLLHPEMRGQRIQPYQRDLAREWIEIRDRRVRPVAEWRARPPAGVPAQPGGGRASIGIDTADMDGNNPDWVRAKAQIPLDFAIIRANEGTTPDGVFRRDWPNLKRAGIVRGAYMFLRFPHSKRRPPASPVVQAQAFIATVGNLDQGDLPPTLDVEFPGSAAETGMTARQLLDGVRAAWKTLRDYYRVPPIIYTSARVWKEDLGNPPAPDLCESPLWLARYYCGARKPALYSTQALAGRSNPPVPQPWGDATNWWIHQYQGDAVRLPGFSGRVDMDRFNTTMRGVAGDRVRWVQRRLGIPQSGAFDAATEQSLRSFQSKVGIAADGVIDPRTFAYLCRSTPMPAPPSVW